MRGYISLCALVLVYIACLAEPSYAQTKPKSVATGRWISITATLGPAAVATGLTAFDDPGTDLAAAILYASGAILGPGCGHLYAERVGRFFGGAGIRTGLVLGGTIATALVGVSIIGGSPETAKGAGVVAVFCAALYLGDVVYDIVTVNRSVDRYNERFKQSNIRIVPHFLSQSRAAGAALSLSFR